MRFGEAGERPGHRERLRAAMGFAAVEHRAVVEPSDIVDQRARRWADRLAGAGLDGAELRPLAVTSGRATGAEPGEPMPAAMIDEEAEPQRDGPAAAGGAVGGFGDGHVGAGG